jgi:hypothetical protein
MWWKTSNVSSVIVVARIMETDTFKSKSLINPVRILKLGLKWQYVQFFIVKLSWSDFVFQKIDCYNGDWPIVDIRKCLG